MKMKMKIKKMKIIPLQKPEIELQFPIESDWKHVLETVP